MKKLVSGVILSVFTGYTFQEWIQA